MTLGASKSVGMGLGGSNDGSSGDSNADGISSAPVPIPGGFQSDKERHEWEEKMGMRPFSTRLACNRG